jgi:uncharacterized protein involved in outer membrane biogenesis
MRTLHTRTALKGIGLGIGAVIIVAVICLALFDWNRLREPISKLASEKSGHPVRIEGDLEVHPFSRTPSVSVSGLVIGNPDWVAQARPKEKDPPLARVGRIDFKLALLPLFRGDLVLPELQVDRPTVFVYRAADGRGNWSSGKQPRQAAASQPPNLPAIRKLVIKEGKLDVVDELRKLTLSGTLAAHESNPSEQRPFHIRGSGTLNRAPFDLRIDGNSLLQVSRRNPYPFEVHVRAGETQLDLNASVTRPFDLRRVQADAKMSGDDLADLYLLTGLALPNTPPYQLSGRLEREGARVVFNKLQGRVGDSDVHGEVTVDTSGARPHLDAKLASKTLDIDDLAAPLGAPPSVKAGETVSKKEQALAQRMVQEKRLFPDATLQVNRVRGMDGTLKYQADSVKANKIPLRHVSMDLKLDHGVMVFDPLTFDMPQGKISGRVHVDARTDDPVTTFDMQISNVQLSQFKPAKSDVAPLDGALVARAKGEGHGNSVAKVMATTDGALTVVLPHGEIREAFAELTGINVSRGLGLLLTKDQEHTDIRCGVADFKVRNGSMQAQNLVFDTDNVLITGRGDVSLDQELFNIEIKGEPKKLRLMRLRSPIEIKGPLRKPSIAVRADKAIGQAGIAAAIGAVVAPLAAVIAFVDPGLAKDANCGALLAEANASSKKSMKTAVGEARTLR